MGRQVVLRFGVGSADGPRSAVWRLWTGKGTSDVYISARTLGGVLKVSLHESGEYRYAFTSEYWDGHASQDTGNRVIESWKRPQPIRGITPGFLIAVPSTEIGLPRRPLPGDTNRYTKDVIWIPPAPARFSTNFTVMFTGPDGPEPVEENRFLARFPLPNGQTVSILIEEKPVTEWQEQVLRASRQAISEFVAKGQSVDRESLEAAAEPRGWLYGETDNGARYFVDISAGFLIE